MKKKIIISVMLISLVILIFMVGSAEAKNPFEIETQFSYSYSSNNRLVVSGYSVIEVINIGKLEVRKVRRNMFNTTFKFRYNYLNTSIEVALPLLMRWDSIIKYADTTESGDPTEEAFLDQGIGDMIINIQTNMNLKKSNNNSNTKFNLGIKTITGKNTYSDPQADIVFGSGHYGLKIGASHFMQLDPVVLFGSINYFWNIEREGFDPGDTTQYSLGMAYALSQNFSINARIEHSYTGHIYNNRKKIVGSSVNAATLYLGGSYVNKNNIPFDFTIGTGLTEDAADFSIQISKPYYF